MGDFNEIVSWSLSGGQLIGTSTGGQTITSSLSSTGNKYGGPLVAIPTGESRNALSFNQEYGAIPITASPTATPTLDGQTASPTTFYSQTFYIQSDFKFDDSDRSWCLQARNVRKNSILNVRPCEDRTKQKWRFDDGKIRLSEKPQYCIINVKGKILKLGLCRDRNIASFSFEHEDGEASSLLSKEGKLTSSILALKRESEKFYMGFNVNEKYESIRLY